MKILNVGDRVIVRGVVVGLSPDEALIRTDDELVAIRVPHRLVEREPSAPPPADRVAQATANPGRMVEVEQ